MGVCWDEDCLDLGRIGMKPSAKFMNTSIAKNIVKNKEWEILEKISLRKI